MNPVADSAGYLTPAWLTFALRAGGHAIARQRLAGRNDPTGSGRRSSRSMPTPAIPSTMQ